MYGNSLWRVFRYREEVEEGDREVYFVWRMRMDFRMFVEIWRSRVWQDGVFGSWRTRVSSLEMTMLISLLNSYSDLSDDLLV